MNARRRCSVSLVVALALAVVVATTTHAQPGGDPPPTKLRLGILEPLDSENGRLMTAFAEAVAATPAADVEIEVVPEAQVADAPTSPEHSVVAQLGSGDIDLALVPSRGWDAAGVRSLQVLQTPFLIDSDALADAVATDPGARMILDGMAAAGFHGLAFWPSELRHPVAYDCTGRAFERPEDMAGLLVRSVPSTISYGVLEAFGAEPVFTGPYSNVDCELGGHEANLGDQWDAMPMTVTGNVVLFPRFHVLAIRTDAFASLDEDQRRAFEEAASDAVSAAVAGRAQDAELGARQCSEFGNRVIHASADDLEAWASAASPIVTMLEEGAETGPLVSAIRELKQRIAPSPLAAACEPALQPRSEVEGTAWSTGLPPDGTYRMELTASQLQAAGEPGTALGDFVGANTLTLRFPDFRIDAFTGAVDAAECQGRYWLTEDGLWHTDWASLPLCGGFADFRWRIEDGSLVIDLVDSNAPAIDTVWFETNPWVRID